MGALRRMWRGLSALARPVFGSWAWQAPAWIGWLASRYRSAGDGAKRHPRALAAAGLGLLLTVGAGTATWHWYRHRPRPSYAAFTIAPPGRTRIEMENAKPDPLLVRFDGSVAALGLVGHEVDSLIGSAPKIAGSWRWRNDRELEFRVRDDWPIGQKVTVSLDKSLFGPKVQLREYGLSYVTAAFTARLSGSELYQDPINPGLKNGVFDLEFSHPVDGTDLEQRIELRMAGQKQGVLGIGRETSPFRVVYDKLKLHASVHSSTLPIPQNATDVTLVVKPGVRAARGGNHLTDPLEAKVRVPGLYSLGTLSVTPLVVDSPHDEPEQVLALTLSAATGERDVGQAVKAWVLPKIRPAYGDVRADGSEDAPYRWYSPGEVTEAVLARAEPLPLSPVPSEREFVETHSFKFHAEVGRFLLVQVDKNLRSFGGYLSARDERFVVQVPEYPARLALMSQGSILALSGERKVVAVARDVPGIRVSIGRLLPAQLQHLVSQASGDFANPRFFGALTDENLVERFERKIPLTQLAHGKTHYESVDLGRYLANGGAERRGVFLLKVRSYDPRAEERIAKWQEAAAAAARAPHSAAQSAADGDEDAPSEEEAADEPQDTPGDQRLLVVTDLGLIIKQSADGSRDVFVQSIATGHPVADAKIEVIARNGTALFTSLTDGAGRAHFAPFSGMQRERTPLLIQAAHEGDLSFLPLNRADRNLDLSRFDIGGTRSAREPNEISAFLFSDRGLYRPGDGMHIGMIVKSADWSQNIAGIPLDLELLDARGLSVKRQKLRLPADGFLEADYTSADTAPTGTYTANLYLNKDGEDEARQLIGSTSLRVQEFEPDRMKVAVHLSVEHPEGWSSPLDLKALVQVQNLFGTPAEKRRVESTLTLMPAYPAFRRYPDYRFYDPQRAKQGYSDTLKVVSTDAEGNASVDLDLKKYANATYRVHLLTRVFEPEGGRSVTAQVSSMVSEQPFLVGFKADGGLDYLARDSKRAVALLAIDPATEPATAHDLKLALVEIRYVSVLERQPNGTYKYESRRKEIVQSEEPLDLPVSGATLPLKTREPGVYAYLIKNGAGLELNRIEYSVAGNANLSRSLERNAELDLHLSKQEFAPGEDIELSIKAPYLGAGLITIERDRVYAVQWFKTTTSASVQHIKLPADFEGNGYVSVQFTRDLGSEEIFASPLSYGVAPFTTRLAARTNVLKLTTPPLVKPGTALAIKLQAARPTRAVVFAVDEGILEVARYQTPDPLGQFFKKRALEVKTSQILDLILPEFRRLMAAAAPGGDGEAAIKRNLNPFKRKRAKPAVYWSGLVDVGAEREFRWTVPDSFNGALKVFAVAVDANAIGVAETETTVRADFVLSPNMPAAVAPGDEFEVSVGVANSVADSGAGAEIEVSARLPPNLEAVGDLRQSLKLDALREGVVRFRLRAKPILGSAAIAFDAHWQNHTAHLSDALSVRPPTPYVTEIAVGHFGASITLPYTRDLYPDYRRLKVGVSTVPLVLSHGLTDYLDDYPHLCTEQLVSRGFPGLVLARHPDLADPQKAKAKAGESTARLVEVLRSRQNAEGGFGLWAASIVSDDFASVYAVHYMLEAREQGEAIPDDLLRKSLLWLQRYAASPIPEGSRDDSFGLWNARNRAYAAYLLTRQGSVTTPIVGSLKQWLNAHYADAWKNDLAAGYLAAVYELQKQEREANRLMGPLADQLGKASGQPFRAYYDDTVRDATLLYLLARHFPDRARSLPPATLQSMLEPLSRGHYNTLSAARLLIALDAYAAKVPGSDLNRFEADAVIAGQSTPVALQGSLYLQGAFANEAKALELRNGSNVTGFYAISSAGFDRKVPTAALAQGLEIEREYLDSQGKPVQAVKTGDEILVRLRMRSLQADYIDNVAVIDLLPGGFEPVLQPAQVQVDEPGDGTRNARRWFNRLGSLGNWNIEYADVRDDRVVLYGTVTRDMTEYSYRIRATNAGTFATAPSIAESMYDRQLVARTAPGRLEVAAPAPP